MVESACINIKNKLPFDILFLIRMKATEFKNEGVHTIDANDIKDYLYHVKWKDQDVMDLCIVVDDIISLRFSDIFDYLKLKVIKEASSLNLDDFSELIAK